MNAILIQAGQDPELIEVEGSLEEFQYLVDGYIEGLVVNTRTICYINGDGKLKDLPNNPKADKILQKLDVNLFEGDYIAGNMVIAGVDDQGGTDDVPDSIVQELGLK